MHFSTNPESNPGDFKTSHRPSVEDARLAAQAINEYMRTRFDSHPAFQGARVATLGSLSVVINGSLRQCWLVNRWDWDHVGLSDALFVEVEQDGRVHLFTGGPIFLEKDLYPDSEPQTPVAQEGGAA